MYKNKLHRRGYAGPELHMLHQALKNYGKTADKENHFDTVQ